MPIGVTDQLGLSNRFVVTANPGSWDLGTWATVSGLEVTWQVPDYRSGDAWNNRWQFPGLTQYQTVKLSRAANRRDTSAVYEWLNTNSTAFEVGEVTIKLLDAKGEEVHPWTLKGALPGKWAIEKFDANASKVAIETLEINHIGFLADERTF